MGPRSGILPEVYRQQSRTQTLQPAPKPLLFHFPFFPRCPSPLLASASCSSTRKRDLQGGGRGAEEAALPLPGRWAACILAVIPSSIKWACIQHEKRSGAAAPFQRSALNTESTHPPIFRPSGTSVSRPSPKNVLPSLDTFPVWMHTTSLFSSSSDWLQG